MPIAINYIEISL